MSTGRKYRRQAVLAALVTLGLFAPDQAAAQACGADALARATLQTLYVPAYSRVLTHAGTDQPLASTMVVHNLDPEVEITLTSVAYFDREGTQLQSFLDAPQTLGPFGSQAFLVPINEQAGGFGANYLLEWTSSKPALSPIVEAVMVGGGGTQGISFTSVGRVIECRP